MVDSSQESKWRSSVQRQKARFGSCGCWGLDAPMIKYEGKDTLKNNLILEYVQKVITEKVVFHKKFISSKIYL